MSEKRFFKPLTAIRISYESRVLDVAFGGQEVDHKMGFSIDPIDRYTYRHRTDRLTAPNAQPEPTIPNPPEFQAQSSPSAAIPSN
ncbi:hypothetical protein Lal_00030086 [Lupinus albus]|nr:hypothetical protein Lal_00030086 [Lupinus albus]